ncbi:fibronectin type III domain-containing protein [Amycolatopsis magusensis]|uniref:fibronectin type III domain-containing protein n=1 Tax=Amycolatopsis magusensis TaxID=882444 RepID=UPI003C2FB28D
MVEPVRWRRRVPLWCTVTALAAVLGVALSGATKPGTEVGFLQSGHWVFNSVLQVVFHLDGASGTLDAQAAMPGAEPGSQVVQGETGGYVVGGNRIVEFGKSDLEAKKSIATGTDERPVALEVAGGPYLVYRQAGRIVRLGDRLTTVPAGGGLGEPVVTTAGSLWVHQPAGGSICELARDADRLACPAGAPGGHTGGLTVVADRPVFVDTTTDTAHPIGADGLGPGTALGVDAPPDARFAATDVAGRIAVLDPPRRRVHLVDTGPGRAAPVSVDLPAGDYAELASAGEAVVLLDRAKNSVLTYDSRGALKQNVPMPPGEPRLAKGEDSRVYVDSHDGGHVLVVGNDGEVRPVPVGGPPTPAAQPPPPPRQPEPPPGPSPKPGQSPKPPPAKTQRQQPESVPAQPQQAPANPAGPPGAPPGVKATAGNAAITVSWGAAAPNGGAVREYHVSWSSSAGGGSRTVAGGTRSTALSGLSNGTTYKITVTAENVAGRGPGAGATGTPVAPERSITLSRGSLVTSIDDCSIPECAYLRVVAKGFAPGQSYTFVPHATATSYQGGSATKTAKADGSITFEAFHFDQIDETVWVTADGLKSNPIVWTKG